MDMYSTQPKKLVSPETAIGGKPPPTLDLLCIGDPMCIGDHTPYQIQPSQLQYVAANTNINK